MNKRKPTIRVVAEWIVGDSSVPDWLVRGLERYAPLVNPSCRQLEDDTALERKMLKAARDLEERLPVFVELRERLRKQFGFEAPDWMDPLSDLLSEVIEFLEWDTAPKHVKWDAPATICAAVVCRAYQLFHDHQSYALGELCDLYWQACGNDQTGKEGDPANWRRDLERVKDDKDQWPLDDLEELRSGRRT
jgi:hypothetical protein